MSVEEQFLQTLLDEFKDRLAKLSDNTKLELEEFISKKNSDSELLLSIISKDKTNIIPKEKG